jgi:hypothetical protein
MNLSGKPGIVQPMQMPPTFGQPPTRPSTRASRRCSATGPAPSLTMHFGVPWPAANPPARSSRHGRSPVHGLAESQRGRSSRRAGSWATARVAEEVQEGLHEVVGLDGAARHATMGMPAASATPAEVVGQSRSRSGCPPSRECRRRWRRCRRPPRPRRAARCGRSGARLHRLAVGSVGARRPSDPAASVSSGAIHSTTRMKSARPVAARRNRARKSSPVS